MKEKVIIGMSGGVDSSVAAYLLKEKGYEVIGVTMVTTDGFTASEDARKVADALEIPYHTLDFRKEFKENVIDYFISEYRQGRTPNPCTVCNRRVKWEALLDRARAFGAAYVATGHYAKIDLLPNGRYAIANADSSKDQTYALYNLSQDQLAHTLMPLGGMEKTEVRAIASSLGLEVASKPDSQDICFVPDGDYAGYIERATGIAETPGPFVDREGNVLGTHKGIGHYTIGQRRGLTLPMGRRIFVTELRPGTNEVVLGENEDLFKTDVTFGNVNAMGVSSFEPGMEFLGKIRYNHRGDLCRVREVREDSVTVTFKTPVRAVTPGQSIVLYRDGYVCGGGTILC